MTKLAGLKRCHLDSMLFSGVSEDKANTILSLVLKEVGNSLVRAVELEQKGELGWGSFESLGRAEKGEGSH